MFCNIHTIQGQNDTWPKQLTKIDRNNIPYTHNGHSKKKVAVQTSEAVEIIWTSSREKTVFRVSL